MPLRCNAVIFDLDGVLVDSQAIIERYWRRWAAKHDIPYDEIEALHHGRTTVEIIEAVAPHLDAEAEAAAMQDREAADTEGLALFEGARRLIDGLPDGRWTIATSGTRRTATTRLDHVGLPTPDTLVTADDVAHGKPAPDPYRLAAERLGVDPARCVVLEDAPVGVESAQRAGTRVIAVASMTSSASLAAADAVVERLDDVTIESGTDGVLHVQWHEAS